VGEKYPKVVNGIVLTTDTGKLKTYKFSYAMVKYDCDMWADAKLFLPEKFDLVTMRHDKGTIRGWWTGTGWDGLNWDGEIEVLYWKKVKGEA